MIYQRFRSHSPAVVIDALMVLVMAWPWAAWAMPLEELLADIPQGRAYCAPSAEEHRQAEALFHQLLTGEPVHTLEPTWRHLGFTLRTVEDGATRFLALVEAEGDVCGRGAYLFRRGAALPVALQAPHSFKDLHTRDIVRSLVAEHPVAAAAWSTVPRHFQRRGQTINADVAHLDSSYFQAFSRAFAAYYPQGYVIQVHGFAQHKRRTTAGAQADVILSSGSDQPSQTLLAIGQCLKPLLSGVVSIYPIDVQELGARTNTIGHAMRQMGHTGFIHLELSRQLRRRWRTHATLRQPLLHCLSMQTAIVVKNPAEPLSPKPRSRNEDLETP